MKLLFKIFIVIGLAMCAAYFLHLPVLNWVSKAFNLFSWFWNKLAQLCTLLGKLTKLGALK